MVARLERRRIRARADSHVANHASEKPRCREGHGASGDEHERDELQSDPDPPACMLPHDVMVAGDSEDEREQRYEQNGVERLRSEEDVYEGWEATREAKRTGSSIRRGRPGGRPLVSLREVGAISGRWPPSS